MNDISIIEDAHRKKDDKYNESNSKRNTFRLGMQYVNYWQVDVRRPFRCTIKREYEFDY